MMTRRFALVVGIIYLVIGIAGFIPGLVQGPGYSDLAVNALSGNLLGLFPVNVVHHIVHLLVGVLAVMGLISAASLDTMFGLTPLFSHDVWLHAGTAVIAAYFGWGPVDDRVEAGSRA